MYVHWYKGAGKHTYYQVIRVVLGQPATDKYWGLLCMALPFVWRLNSSFYSSSWNTFDGYFVMPLHSHRYCKLQMRDVYSNDVFAMVCDYSQDEVLSVSKWWQQQQIYNSGFLASYNLVKSIHFQHRHVDLPPGEWMGNMVKYANNIWFGVKHPFDSVFIYQRMDSLLLPLICLSAFSNIMIYMLPTQPLGCWPELHARYNGPVYK